MASQVELELDVLEEMRDSIDFDDPDNQVKVLSDLRHRFVEDFLVNIRRIVDVNCNLLNATNSDFTHTDTPWPCTDSTAYNE